MYFDTLYLIGLISCFKLNYAGMTKYTSVLNIAANLRFRQMERIIVLVMPFIQKQI